jgi:beta-N-acetylhexosaminidase
MAMTAHIVLAAIDPVAPATISATISARGDSRLDRVRWIVDDGRPLHAGMSGTLGERAAAAIAAGCDVVLHCNGRPDEMQTVAAAVPGLEGEARRRARAALSWARRASAIDLAAARAEFADMIASDPEAHAAKMQVTS